MNVELVHPDLIPGIWGEVRGDVLKALEYTDNWNERAILQSLLAYPPTMHLWRCEKAVCVTHFSTYPTRRVCGLLLVAGQDRESWLHFQETIGRWAKENGCAELVGYARKGWLRVLDWTPDYTYIRKKL